MAVANSSMQKGGKIKAILIALGVVTLPLGLLFLRSLQPDHVVFSNDGPFGAMMADLNKPPEILRGVWANLNWLGGPGVSPAPTVSTILRLSTSPVWFAKLYAPFSMWFLGMCSWVFFRRLNLTPLACLLGAIAVTLNSNFFSSACWGVCSHPITFGAAYLAIAAVAPSPSSWKNVLLAGLAVGVAIMEGYDIGAIFSLYVAAFMLYQAWISEGPGARKLPIGMLRIGVVAILSALVAAHTLSSLVSTQVKGVTGETDNMSAEERWDWATQWSMPPRELPRIYISGLYGYRMDTPRDMAAFQDWFQGGVYWGEVGRPPGLDRYIKQYHEAGNAGMPPGLSPDLPWRFSGGGEYAGVLVLVVSLWALAQSFRKKESIFASSQRKFIWFWAGAAFISLLLAMGRYAPFYRLFYLIPHASNIRNASKFMHTFHWSLVILFAYGVHGLCGKYLAAEPIENAPGKKPAAPGRIAGRPRTGILDVFDKRWMIGSLAVIALSLLGWLLYASDHETLVKNLMGVGFPDPGFAARIARFSSMEVGFFVLFLILTVVLLGLVFRYSFAGQRARLGGILLGGLLLIDLGRSDLPWIIYQNYVQKYANNPVLEFLENKPYEHRVALFPLDRFTDLKRLPPDLAASFSNFAGVYRIEWAQHHFQYYNIQAIEDVQRPREAADFKAYERGPVARSPIRHWELMNTRYFLAPIWVKDSLNTQMDAGKGRFQVTMQFNLEGTRAVPDTNGQYAIFEFTGALPRAKLYSNWLNSMKDTAALNELGTGPIDTNDLAFLKAVGTNDFLTLRKLASPSFDPQQAVIVSEPLPAGLAPTTNGNPGTVEITGYAPKHVTLNAKAQSNCVLLLNDKYEPNWRVTVDGKPETLLRCNYIMRGVALTPGDHKVDFYFAPPLGSLYVSLAAILLGAVLVGVLFVFRNKEEYPTATAEPQLAASSVSKKDPPKSSSR